ncbi:hypothetical protein JYA63_07135 [Fictibacillus nanhaiensis]|uniref:DUF4179 domain-containing protein n=1 Tax=Fictibacillus nanhaiensis TaxID=742169 RepID=A0ABS2ZRU9_9BACL|nr:hypothetical protein [Fictibacillus nanhaiensis]
MMEERLKKLSTSMDPEISKVQVFTDKDKQQILTRIRKLSVPQVRSKRPRTLLPRLLTAALFSGIIFSTYVYFDKEPVPQTQPNVQIKQEEPPVIIQNVSGLGSSVEYSSNSEQKKLKISLLITNKSDSPIKNKLKYRVTFLNSSLVKATGSESFIIEPPMQSAIESGDTISISKEIILSQGVAKEELENAIKIETISDSKAFHSFVIDSIEYEETKQIEKDKAEVPQQQKEEKKEEPVPVVVSEGEAKQILNRNLADIKQTLINSEKKNNWNSENPATYEVAGPDFKPYVTERFSNQVLKTLLPKYFCGCDIGFLPRIHQEVRFKVNGITEDTIEFSGIEPASDMNNVGSQWRFKLVKENNEWKMDQWDELTLQQANLELTKEEAGKLLSTETNTVGFHKEIQINGTNVYVFTVKDENGENIFGVDTRNTSLVYDIE